MSHQVINMLKESNASLYVRFPAMFHSLHLSTHMLKGQVGKQPGHGVQYTDAISRYRLIEQRAILTDKRSCEPAKLDGALALVLNSSNNAETWIPTRLWDLHLYVELRDLAVCRLALSACEWKDEENGTWLEILHTTKHYSL